MRFRRVTRFRIARNVVGLGMNQSHVDGVPDARTLVSLAGKLLPGNCVH